MRRGVVMSFSLEKRLDNNFIVGIWVLFYYCLLFLVKHEHETTPIRIIKSNLHTFELIHRKEMNLQTYQFNWYFLIFVPHLWLLLCVLLCHLVPGVFFLSPLWWFISPEQESQIHCEYLISPCLPLILLMLTHAVYYSIENLQQYCQEREEQHNVCSVKQNDQGLQQHMSCHPAVSLFDMENTSFRLRDFTLNVTLSESFPSSESSSNAFMLDEGWENNREALECLRRFFP